MDLTTFIDEIANNVFTETPRELLNEKTVFMELDEWSSMTAFSLISFIEEKFGKSLMLIELLQAQTIEDLYTLVKN